MGYNIVTGAMGAIDENRLFMIPGIHERQTLPPGASRLRRMPAAMQALRRGTATETGEADDNASDNASDNAPASADGGEGTVFQVEDSEEEATFGGEEAHYPQHLGNVGGDLWEDDEEGDEEEIEEEEEEEEEEKEEKEEGSQAQRTPSKRNRTMSPDEYAFVEESCSNPRVKRGTRVDPYI